MTFRRKNTRQIPELNTASLPDLIFTVLFFFMIVTTMKQTDVKVRYDVPHGTELQKLQHQNTSFYIYIGRASHQETNSQSDEMLIQLNDRLVSTDEITSFLHQKRMQLTEKEKEKMTVIVQADKETPMKTIKAVKLAIRKAKVFHIKYAARENAFNK